MAMETQQQLTLHISLVKQLVRDSGRSQNLCKEVRDI